MTALESHVHLYSRLLFQLMISLKKRQLKKACFQQECGQCLPKAKTIYSQVYRALSYDINLNPFGLKQTVNVAFLYYQ